MRRVIRLLLVAALFAVVWWASPTPPATAAGAVVKIDLAYANASSSVCNPLGYDCTTTYTGSGRTLDGMRPWNITLTFGEGSCRQTRYGTFAVTAADGSGDGLSGSIWGDGSSYYPTMTIVRAGTGAYAGTPVGNAEAQKFGQVGVPATAAYGAPPCGNAVSTGENAGSLVFHLP